MPTTLNHGAGNGGIVPEDQLRRYLCPRLIVDVSISVRNSYSHSWRFISHRSESK